VNPRRTLIPYLLLAVLTLGAGLSAGLALAGPPITHTATSVPYPWAPCTITRNGTETKVKCRSVVYHVTPSSFTYGSPGFGVFFEQSPKVSKDFATCMTSALIHVVPRVGHISVNRGGMWTLSRKLQRKSNAIYTGCGGLKGRS
jgi:hypothetical protein